MISSKGSIICLIYLYRLKNLFVEKLINIKMNLLCLGHLAVYSFSCRYCWVWFYCALLLCECISDGGSGGDSVWVWVCYILGSGEKLVGYILGFLVFFWFWPLWSFNIFYYLSLLFLSVHSWMPVLHGYLCYTFCHFLPALAMVLLVWYLGECSDVTSDFMWNRCNHLKYFIFKPVLHNWFIKSLIGRV